MNNCIFCRIADKTLPSAIVFENDRILAFRDAKPEAPVHILIIPKKHIERITDIGPNEMDLVSQIAVIANQLARKEKIDQNGFRLVINCNKDGGQTVFHLHMHLLGGRILNWPPG